MAHYYTNTYDLMLAIKRNLQQYSPFDETNTVDSVNSWNVGFVFPETILPAITVFPISKTFKPRQSGGRTPVDYRFSIELYSRKYRYLSESKDWVYKASEMVTEVVKSRQKMEDSNGKKHCFNIQIEGIQVLEPMEIQGRGFRSKGSIDIVCTSLHQMDEGRVNESKSYYCDSEEFIEKIEEYVKKGITSPEKIAGWQSKLAKKIIKFPSVLILPRSEVVDEFYTNRNDIFQRDYSFYIVSRGYPKKNLLKDNIEIADMVVVAIEKNYSVGGFAISSEIQNIDYRFGDIDANFQFYSTINVDYACRRLFDRVKM